MADQDLTLPDYGESPPRMGKTLAQLQREAVHRRQMKALRSCLTIPALWLFGIVVPVALTFFIGPLWVIVLYVAGLGVFGTAYWQGRR